MSLLSSMRTLTVALAALCLGATLAGSASALSIDCAGAGCLVGVYTIDFSESTPNLAGPNGNPFASLLTGRICSRSNRTSLCVDLEPRSERGNTYTWRGQLGSSRIFDELRTGSRHTLPTRHQGWVLADRGTANPIPEPSAALIFGAGMLVASGLVKRTGSIE